MTEHQASPERADLRIVEGVSPARLHGEACIHCGSVEPHLFPDGRVQTRITEGVLKAWDVVTCLPCMTGTLVLQPRERYVVERQEPVGRQPGMYAIRDKQTGGLVPSSDGEGLELFTMLHSAEHWITTQISCGAARGR